MSRCQIKICINVLSPTQMYIPLHSSMHLADIDIHIYYIYKPQTDFSGLRTDSKEHNEFTSRASRISARLKNWCAVQLDSTTIHVSIENII